MLHSRLVLKVRPTSVIVRPSLLFRRPLWLASREIVATRPSGYPVDRSGPVAVLFSRFIPVGIEPVATRARRMEAIGTGWPLGRGSSPCQSARVRPL